jgi:hypothetical protein
MNGNDGMLNSSLEVSFNMVAYFVSYRKAGISRHHQMKVNMTLTTKLASA